jgi:hypothetical protein
VDSGGESTISADPVSRHDREWLRQEIVDSKKSQVDFLKWKFSLLCLVPLICAYVDLIGLHVMVRVRTIGGFLKEPAAITRSLCLRFAKELERTRTDSRP